MAKCFQNIHYVTLLQVMIIIVYNLWKNIHYTLLFQDPKNKRFTICDEQLQHIFGMYEQCQVTEGHVTYVCCGKAQRLYIYYICIVENVGDAVA